MKRRSLKCQLCYSEKLRKVLDLGYQPPSDSFLTKEELKSEVSYPLQLFYCRKCSLVQLGYIVDPRILFGDRYVYMSQFSGSLRRHLRSLAESLSREFQLSEKDLAIDIGSNDGTLLEGYLPYKLRVLGVEPTKVAERALEKGIPTVTDFFNETTAKQILAQYGRAKVTTATNVFAHVDNLFSFVNGVKLLLEDVGIFVVESHYLLDLITNLEYDSIYHEHLRYYSVQSLINVFRHFQMDVFHVERIPTHGGSIRVFACKPGLHKKSRSIKDLLNLEKKLNIRSLKTLDKFKGDVDKNRLAIRNLLLQIKSKGNRIAGIGAPAKSTTLLNSCKIGPDILEYVVETNDYKIGKYTPGTHIKIVHERILYEDQPEYALLLSWNLKDDIVNKLRNNGYNGKIIVPIPRCVII